MSQKTMIAVVGCHRSGTSATAGVLQCLGVSVGEGPLLSPRPDNPKGFFENAEVVELQDRLLRTLGGDHYRPSLPDGWMETPQAAEALDRLRSLLRRDYPEPLSAVKDPRMTLLFPLWRRAWEEEGIRGCALLVNRPVTEIAASIMQRDAVGRSEARRIVGMYAVAAEEWRAVPHTRISYGQLWDHRELHRVGEDLDIAWPFPPDLAWPAVMDFLDPRLRHHRS